MKIFIPVIFALFLSGCLSEANMKAIDPSVMSMPIPPNYKDIIRDHMKSTLLDYRALRDVRISEPAAFTDGGGRPHWLVCVEYNAKNGYGAYIGLDTYAYKFSNGRFWGPYDFGVPVFTGVCNIPRGWSDWPI